MGGMFEAGALRALDDILTDRTVNDLDVYVGTSAGAILASALANRLSTRWLMRFLSGDGPPGQRVERGVLFPVDWAEMRRRVRMLPGSVVLALMHYLRHRADMDLVDFLLLFSEALPAGFFTTAVLEERMREVFSHHGHSDSFRRLPADLLLVATELESGDRRVFGRGFDTTTPVSRAAAASAALPVFYSPVRIGDHDYVDGGIRGSASVDLAVERGAGLVICVNPLVPYQQGRRRIPFLGADHTGRLSEKGAPHIFSQVFRTWTGAALEYQLKNLRRRHPEVDFVLIEPRRDDPRIFFFNPMRYSSRLLTARHGYESVLLQIDEGFALYRDIFARHGLSITRTTAHRQQARIRRSGYDPAVIRDVLEARRRRPLEPRRAHTVESLTTTLERLDRRIAYLQPAG
jgi:predicted acylesterase/phospholipase RssA